MSGLNQLNPNSDEFLEIEKQVYLSFHENRAKSIFQVFWMMYTTQILKQKYDIWSEEGKANFFKTYPKEEEIIDAMNDPSKYKWSSTELYKQRITNVEALAIRIHYTEILALKKFKFQIEEEIEMAAMENDSLYGAYVPIKCDRCFELKGQRSSPKWLKKKRKIKRKYEHYPATDSCPECPKYQGVHDKEYDSKISKPCKGCGRYYWFGKCEHCEFTQHEKEKCPYCKKDFSRNGGLVNHYKSCYDLQMIQNYYNYDYSYNRINCKACNLPVREKNLPAHLLNCPEMESFRTECPKCKKGTFPDIRHYCSKRLDFKVRCRVCKRNFKKMGYNSKKEFTSIYEHERDCKGGPVQFLGKKKRKVVIDKNAKFTGFKTLSKRSSCDRCNKPLCKGNLKDHELYTCVGLNNQKEYFKKRKVIKKLKLNWQLKNEKKEGFTFKLFKVTKSSDEKAKNIFGVLKKDKFKITDFISEEDQKTCAGTTSQFSNY